jgi:hypothetical protein
LAINPAAAEESILVPAPPFTSKYTSLMLAELKVLITESTGSSLKALPHSHTAFTLPDDCENKGQDNRQKKRIKVTRFFFMVYFPE